MKQGSGNNSHSGMKQEPIAHAMSPKGVGQIGLAQAKDRATYPLDAGRGYEAPKGGTTIHHSGSQGKR